MIIPFKKKESPKKFMSYEDLKTMKKEISRLQQKGEILDPSNNFDRRELQSVIRQLRDLLLIR